MAINYAPIVDNEIVPAFYDKGLYIYFKHNPAVDPNEVTGFRAIIKEFITGNIIHTTSRTDFGEKEDILSAINNGKIFMGGADSDDIYSDNLTPGNFYKFQLCYLYNDNTKESPYSYAIIGRYLGATTTDSQIKVELTQSNRKFIGSTLLNNSSLGERIYQYRFDLKDNDGNVIDTSDWKLYDYTSGDTDYNAAGNPIYTIYYNFGSEKKYTMRYSIITHNGYECSATVEFTGSGDGSSSDLLITATQNTIEALENGYVNIGIEITDGSTLENCWLLRKSQYSDFWEKIYNFGTNTAEGATVKDNTVEQGESYEYSLINSQGWLIKPSISSTSTIITPDFENMYLSDKNCQLCIRFDPKVSSFKTTLLEQKIDTLGGKYPIFARNGMVNYKEIGISGLISYHMDKDGLFFKKDEWVGNYIDDYNTVNLSKGNFYLERQFRDKVVKWLTNGEPKLFRSPTEGNMIVRLMNVSINPNEQLSRMTYSFSATGYEVDDIKGQVENYVIE